MFQSILTSSAVIADNSAGDFEIVSGKLTPGDHHVSLYLEDEWKRSKTIKIPFTIWGTESLHESAGMPMHKKIIYFMLFSLSSIFLFVVFGRKKEKESLEEMEKRLENM